MEDFVLYNPVKLHFGKGVAQKTGKFARQFGAKALLVYGNGSVMNNGAWQDVVSSLTDAGVEIVAFGGIRPNPVMEDVDRAALIGRNEKVDMVVAVGGGSVIDSAKMMAIAIPSGHDVWDFITGQSKPRAALPLLAVLTLAATGTEMNHYAVIQNNHTKQKVGYGHPSMYPRHSFLDPGYTLSVSAYHTGCGIADLVAHSLEAWFGIGDSPLSDHFILSIIREAMEAGTLLLNDLQNYPLRARIMYAATCALNGMTVPGKKSQDWGVHAIGHCLSVVYDLAHGASLTIAYPAWMKHQLHQNAGDRISLLGKALFNTIDKSETITAFESFFRKLGCPVRLSEAGIYLDDSKSDHLLEVMQNNQVSGLAYPIDHKDLPGIIQWMK